MNDEIMESAPVFLDATHEAALLGAHHYIVANGGQVEDFVIKQGKFDGQPAAVIVAVAS